MKMFTKPDTEETIDTCNKMLRGERSAVETYDIALEKFGNDPGSVELRRIRDEHWDSVNDLTELIQSLPAVPDIESGAWGTFATLVQKTATLFGEGSAVEVLALGESKGLNDYEEAIAEGNLSVEAESLFRGVLIPRIESHLITLARISEVVS